MNQVYILLLPFVQFTMCLVLISVVILSAPRDRLNRIFALFLLAMGLWGLTIFWMRDAFPNAERAYAVEKVVLAVIPFSSIIFYHFVFAFARVPRSRAVLYVFYGLGIISAAFSLAGWSATGMVQKFYGFAPALGWAFPLMLLAAYPPVFLAIYDLTKTGGRATGSKERSQLKLLRLGALASVLGGTSDYVPSLGINIYPLGVLGNIAFGVLATWAVTRYRMMELRLALRRGLAHVLISSALFAAYGAVFVIVWFFAHEQSATAITISSAGTILIVGLFIQPVLGRVQSFVDRVFFRERVDRLHAMVQLNADVRDITDFSLTAHRLVQGVRRAVQSDWVAIVLPDPSETVFVARADSRGTPPEVELPMDGAVASWLRRRQKALTATDVRTDPYLQAMSEGESAALKDLGAVLLVPLRDRTLLTGILAVGPKLVADDYSAADVEFLVAVADQTGLAIQHARMYADEHRRLAELENLGTLKSNLLQTVSHELKSPITAIKIATELLESAAAAGVSGDRRDRLIRTLKSGIDRLERLTQEALDYAAMQSAQLQLQPTDITLEDVVHEAASLLTPAMRARGQKFSVQTDPGVGLTHADAPRIERILSNLISNACKYTPENGEIRITISRDGDYHLVEVSDTGRGIPENDLELIFSPFYRSRNADGTSVGGSGLGLSIARFLAELHGGRLTVKSTVGLGSVFSLYLPAKGPPDRRGATAAEENGSAAPREPGRADASPKATTPREPVAPAGPRQSS